MNTIYKDYTNRLKEGERWKKEKVLSDDEVKRLIVESVYRLRKLTPLECWRLMGFTDEDFYKAQEVFVDFQNLPSHDERGRLIEKLGVALNHYLQIKDD